MAGSEVEIASAALVHLGRDQISSFDDTSRQNASLLKERYPPLRNKLLRTYPWNFAMRFARLPGSELDVPMFGFTHKCVLPAGGSQLPYCEKLWRVEGKIKYQVRGRELYVDATPPIAISYVARIEDANEFDPIFSELLALDLALALMNKLATDEIKRRRREMMAERRALRREARLSDAMESSPPETEDEGSWLKARRPL